jgi:hypothetical protein
LALPEVAEKNKKFQSDYPVTVNIHQINLKVTDEEIIWNNASLHKSSFCT